MKDDKYLILNILLFECNSYLLSVNCFLLYLERVNNGILLRYDYIQHHNVCISYDTAHLYFMSNVMF